MKQLKVYFFYKKINSCFTMIAVSIVIAKSYCVLLLGINATEQFSTIFDFKLA